MSKQTAFSLLTEISQIEDKELRRNKLRDVCRKHKPIALAIQYAYHPDVVFDLPKGIEKFGKINKVPHMDFSLTFVNIKKMKMFWTTSLIPQSKKISLFAGFIRDVIEEDVPLLIGIKDGVLPWKTLNKAFCTKALPELFPSQEHDQ